MSYYTTQLRWIVEQKQTEAGVDPSASREARNDFTPAYEYLGLDDYPIFDETYRQTLNDKIIRHYYFHEIGFETAAQFAWFLRTRMHEIMPYYNQLYESQDLITDPLTNRKLTWREVWELAQGGTTTTTDTHAKTRTGSGTERTDDDLTHGHTVNETDAYGHTINETDTYGRTQNDTTTFGKTQNGNTTTSYGRTTNSANGGADHTTEGATKERVITDDTPMNQIANDGVYNLNYASNVTYTDREGTGASTVQYGGTTAVTNGGSDQTTSSTTDGGTEGKSSRAGGSDTTATTHGGTDTRATTNGGTDQRDVSTTRSDTETVNGTDSSNFRRALDEDGNKEHTASGYDGTSPAKLLQEYRETFLNVDLQVINRLGDLFFGLWN